jgi:predicted enzyme related to lactoylglutathione lyase
MPGFNGIGWFEVGTDDPAAAERFYGDVFGWTVSHDDTKSPDPAYQIFTTGDAEGLHGGLFATRGKMPSYAVFTVLVEDVEAACRRRTGGWQGPACAGGQPGRGDVRAPARPGR